MEDNLEPILENLLMATSKGNQETADLLENNIQATMKVAEAVEENAKKVPTIRVSIDGAEATTYQGAKGEKGEDGKTPEKGVDYFTPEDIAEIATKTASIIGKPKDGKDGKDGESVRPEQVASILRGDPSFLTAVKGKDGKSGKDANPTAVAQRLVQNEDFLALVRGEQGERGENGKDGSPDTGEDIVRKLSELDKDKRLSFDVLKDTPTFGGRASKTTSLSELDDVDLSGATFVNGKYVIGGGSGAVDSVNGQTGVVVLDTDDIADTATNRYTNDTDIARLANTSGTNTGDQDLSGYELLSNKSTDTALGSSNTLYPSQNAVKTYVDGVVAGLLDYRGAYNASTNVFPSTGGSGTAGAILKGDLFIVSVAGTLGGSAVQIGDSLIAAVDTPGQTAGNWNILNANISYVPEDVANKENTTIDTSTTKYPTVNLLKTGLDTKQNTITGGATTIVSSNLTASRALASDGSGKVAVSATTATELGFVSGVTSAIQTQINAKLDATAYDDATAAETTTGTSTTKYVSPDGLAGSTIFGRKSISMYVVPSTTDVLPADGQFFFMIPEALNGMNLVRAIARVNTAGTTNATTIDIFNVTDSVDMLSTAISIASGGTLGTAGTVNTATDDVATNDFIRIDVTTASTTRPKGLTVVLEFQLP